MDPGRSGARPRLRLEALDGIRGLAALFVVYFHIGVLLSPVMATMSGPWRLLHRATEHGHEAVVAFIVLSGFVLMLPVVRAGRPPELASYFARRSRRILPPYFAALAIFLLAGIGWNLAASSTLANPFIHDASFGGILSHFFLLQNWKRSWALTVDPPMWTVATEWQIYFFFPFVLLPIWRRLGSPAAVLAGLCIGMLPVVLLPRNTNFDTFCPWFLALFALGMTAAAISTSSRVSTFFQKPMFWGFTTVILFLGIGLFQMRLHAYWNQTGIWCKDFLNGVAIASLLVYLARCQLSGMVRQPLIARVLESPVCVQLGAFSYSLYLTHLPIVDLIVLALRSHLRGTSYVITLFVLAPPAAVACAYVFHLAFERPASLDRYGRMLGRWKRKMTPEHLAIAGA